MIIHIFADTPHHYIPMQAFFSNTCSVDCEQVFWAKLEQDQSHTTGQGIKASVDFIYYQDAKDLIKRMKGAPINAQFVFHGLFDIHVWKGLLFSSLLRRTSCVFWGAELYRHGKANRNLKEKVAHVLHGIFINRLKKVFALNSGDAELATQHLKRKAIDVLPYPIIGIDTSAEPIKRSSGNDTPLAILVGNSAATSNNHIDAFNQIRHLANENIEVIVPLSYAGTPNYIEQVILKGKQYFGTKFTPHTEMMDKDVFDQLLTSIDVCLFAQNRQQGLYAVYAMFLHNKALFLKQETTSYRNFTSQGYQVNTFESISDMSFNSLLELASSNNSCEEIDNRTLMKSQYTEQALAPRWSSMLNDLLANSELPEHNVS